MARTQAAFKAFAPGGVIDWKITYSHIPARKLRVMQQPHFGYLWLVWLALSSRAIPQPLVAENAITSSFLNDPRTCSFRARTFFVS
jgi:hypothetical protein